MHTNLIEAENGKPIVAQKVVIVPRVLRQDVGDRIPLDVIYMLVDNMKRKQPQSRYYLLTAYISCVS